ncbi:hypothetical protein HY024_01595 [Candidatus Curtissbacteria bacterium]|nr:hypothetical protein [Candidatus Curtissbacteria bacterium]
MSAGSERLMGLIDSFTQIDVPPQPSWFETMPSKGSLNVHDLPTGEYEQPVTAGRFCELAEEVLGQVLRDDGSLRKIAAPVFLQLQLAAVLATDLGVFDEIADMEPDHLVPLHAKPAYSVLRQISEAVSSQS